MFKLLIDKARLVHALKSSKKYLSKDGKTKHSSNLCICYALDDAYHKNNISFTERESAKSLIMSRLDGPYTLQTWLNDREYFGTKKQYQQHRHAWLDLLIEEFSYGNSKNTKTT